MKDIREYVKSKLIDYGAVVTDTLNLGQEHLFGREVRIMPRDLVYLILELESEYKIQFEKEDFENPNFYSVAGLTEAVERKMGVSS